MKNIARELKRIAKDLIGRDGVASEIGEYKNFSGEINFMGNKAKVKSATFDLYKHGGIIWFDGVWLDGIWKTGYWIKGVWEKGTWHNGNWEDGTWKGGTWESGHWEDGAWGGGVWKEPPKKDMPRACWTTSKTLAAG